MRLKGYFSSVSATSSFASSCSYELKSSYYSKNVFIVKLMYMSDRCHSAIQLKYATIDYIICIRYCCRLRNSLCGDTREIKIETSF